MKQSIIIISGLLFLVGCGPSREELIKKITDEYSVLDCNTLRLEHKFLSGTIEKKAIAQMREEIRDLAAEMGDILSQNNDEISRDEMDQIKWRLDDIAYERDSASMTLYQDRLRLEVIEGLLNKCSAESE